MYLEERVRRLESILTRMLEENPEICPHDYQWVGSTNDKKKYVCALCGKKEEK